jgi:hypothetical protein
MFMEAQMSDDEEKRVRVLVAALRLIARGYDGPESFSGTMCSDIAGEALETAGVPLTAPTASPDFLWKPNDAERQRIVDALFPPAGS